MKRIILAVLSLSIIINPVTTFALDTSTNDTEEYKEMPYKDVARDKDGLRGENIEVTGQVAQVFKHPMFGDKMIRFTLFTKISDFDGKFTYNDVYIVDAYKNDLDFNILEDDILTIKGVLWGYAGYTSWTNTEVSYPSILLFETELMEDMMDETLD
ncbi:hypothetical protein ACEN33_00780 [Ruoffia sp. FAM 24228]|uniref:hypothetical protein n=1 Tax=Ruoffia sp. FAM 24228 TaxID=3259517 RepID=UPI00388AE571